MRLKFTRKELKEHWGYEIKKTCEKSGRNRK